MKTVRFGLVIIAAILMCSTAITAGAGGTHTDALSHAQFTNPVNLFRGAALSLKNTDLYAAGIQYFAGEIRARTDVACYPPAGSGGDSPLALLGAMNDELSQAVMPEMTKNPVLFARVTARLDHWNPAVASNYSPGWQYRSACSDYSKIAQSYKRKIMTSVDNLSMLLQIPAYKAAFDIAQAYNLASPEERKKPERIKAAHKAQAMIIKIEKQKGVYALTSMIHH
ncbi:MAG: hypothetical protein KGK44_11515 [Gammaproteobacteria bacterium]|nr:hypothetical protein [Gammaproteobacteria bacterium]